MGKTTHSQASSERKKWDKIFNGLVKMLKSQQKQLETLAKERKILEDLIKMQQERWVSDVRLYEDHISQTKSDMFAQEMTRLLEAAKSDMVLGLKHREASLLKLKLEHTDDELADVRAWFDLLRQNPKDSEPKSVGSKLFEELRRRKLEYDKISSVKRSEVSTLLAENYFVWHQYKLMETDLARKLNSKCAEFDQANEKIVKLLASMEQLQSSDNEKDEFIARLKTKIAEMEASTSKGNHEIARLTQELELLRKYRSAPVTPGLNSCTAGARTFNGGGSVQNGINTTVQKEWLTRLGRASVTPQSNHCRTGAETLWGKNGSNVVVKKELPDTGTGSRSRSVKRKAVDVISISDTPKLFSRRFKVPKLKNSSTHVR